MRECLALGLMVGFFKPIALCITLAMFQYGSYSCSILQLPSENSDVGDLFCVVFVGFFISLSRSPIIGPGTYIVPPVMLRGKASDKVEKTLVAFNAIFTTYWSGV